MDYADTLLGLLAANLLITALTLRLSFRASLRLLASKEKTRISNAKDKLFYLHQLSRK
jgi:hypothetical protein